MSVPYGDVASPTCGAKPGELCAQIAEPPRGERWPNNIHPLRKRACRSVIGHSRAGSSESSRLSRASAQSSSWDFRC
jgi:hypothetical protein